MSGNSFGKSFVTTSFGESHGPAIGGIVDGCPPGLELAEADLQVDLDRRRPGQSRHTTQRRESDQVHILSGVFEGRTTGTPIALVIYNEDQRSKDYAEIAEKFRRPGPRSVSRPGSHRGRGVTRQVKLPARFLHQCGSRRRVGG